MPRCNNLNEVNGSSPVFCSGLGIGEQGSILNNLNRAIVICPDANYAQNLQAQLTALNKTNCCVLNFDKPYTLSTFSSRENVKEIINALFLIATKNPIILTTPAIINTPLPNINQFKQNILNLKTGNDYDIKTIEKHLAKIGYKKTDSVTEQGEFSVRGDIVDIFNVIDQNPIRLDFFDTELTSIYYYDYLSFEKIKKEDEINISPNKLLFIEEEKESILKNLDNYKLEDDIIYELISNIENNNEIPLEFIKPFYELDDITSLNLPIVILNKLQINSIYSKLIDNINIKINSNFKTTNLQNLYKNSINYSDLESFFDTIINNLVFFDNLDLFKTDLVKELKTTPVKIEFNTKQFNSFLLNLNNFYKDIQPYLDKKIYLCLSSESTLNSVKTIFEKTKVPYTTNKNAKGIILTTLNIPFNICFLDSDTFYIGSSNFAHKKEGVSKNKTTVKYLPKAGEYVVHSTHGIGKCEGVISMKSEGVEKEFFLLTYRGGKLYVPCENADCLSLYMADGEAVALNKLGGKEFALQKQKAAKAIEDMSKELIELYAKRKASKGFKYGEDDYLFTEFEAAFPYNETADQLQAIADIKKDMTNGKVMDRLICGDVGFGKTEVAMRALFKAVQHGKQVAMLAPTTILSLQHYNTVINRTKEFGVRVAMLNRFKSNKEQKEIIEKLKQHKVDVVCGTHRLVSDDVQFDDLGLLILDEEQRFGVKTKEKIKNLKHNVDVLTLSATPIPRTLSMSLMNIRDISIINTPPVNRLPVKTYVISFDLNVVANAVNEELKRGGQVLVVYNNIEKIYAFKETLSQAVNNPNAVFDVAHGQMSELALEKAIERLYNKQTNVFVSTTLIENGIDLPLANTLIVIESDRLGLSQMYQLRGRVGRSKEQAYAYFTHPRGKVLTEDASNRLQAIAENTELGSGFKIAMRDLQIRGAGELLGKVQHGHMIKIGYEMYTKLLNDTIKRLQGEKVEIERDVKIDIALSSIIPHNFVDEESVRLQIIAKISNISTKDDAKKLLNELILQYGKLPKEIYQLTNIAIIRALAIKQNVKQITLNNRVMQVVFYEDYDLNQLLKRVAVFNRFKFVQSKYPTIVLDTTNNSITGAQNYLTEFLHYNEK